MSIAIIAPSSPVGMTLKQVHDLGNTLAAKIGQDVIVMPHVTDSMRFAAGTDANRAADVMTAFQNPDVTAILTVRGGYASNRILDKLDYDTICRNPKPVFGFSDTTALQAGLWQRAGITGYSGFQLNFLNRDDIDTKLWTSFMNALNGQPVALQNLSVMTVGVAEGIAVGGTLSVLVGLMGTPYFSDMQGRILIVEEVSEEPYKVDRMLTQLRLAGVLDEVAGIALGDFAACVAKDPSDGTIEDVLNEHFATLPVPVIRVPYGHRNGQTVVPIGKQVRIDADNGTFEELV